MPLPPNLRPLAYLITSGEATDSDALSSEPFNAVVALARRAVAARIELFQIREKQLSARALYELTRRLAEITRGTETRLLVNDRADIALSAGADGVHLTSRSFDAATVRRAFGEDFIIGVSTHTLEEVRAARAGGADFAVFGPVFNTPSKREFGAPLGLEKLNEAAHALPAFPLVAIGGVSESNARLCIEAGAAGVAAIRMFAESENLSATLERALRGV